MQVNQLPAELAKCHGFQCQDRERCARYMERNNYGTVTPFASHLCDGEGLNKYIPVKVVE